MADSLYLVSEYLLARIPHTIQCGVCRDGEVPVIYIVESISGIAHLGLPCLVPCLLHLVGIHTVGEIEGRRYVEVFEEGE